MAGAITVIKKSWEFVSTKLWHVRISKMDGRRGFFIKQLRIFSLAIKGFNEDKCLTKASALTFYTLFSIVPILALVFAIAKAVGWKGLAKISGAVLLAMFAHDLILKVFSLMH